MCISAVKLRMHTFSSDFLESNCIKAKKSCFMNTGQDYF